MSETALFLALAALFLAVTDVAFSLWRARRQQRERDAIQRRNFYRALYNGDSK